MEFMFFTNEYEEVLGLVKEIFNIENDNTTFNLQELGKKMFDKVMEIAIENKIDNIELTSNKNRVEARNMYMNCGMNIKDTDVFVKQV